MQTPKNTEGTAGGLLLVDKPAGVTSHDVVAAVRRYVRPLRVGHTGTLDPLAGGLLILCVGEAVKITSFVEGQNKIYRAVALLGVQTDTEDVTGKITSQTAVENITEERVREVARRFIGDVEQRPPAFSAIMVEGVRAYKLARRAKPFEIKSRRIYITRFDVESVRLPRVEFTVECSKGTYVRTLCKDLGAALGVGGCMESLRRLGIGRFTVAGARPLAEFSSSESILKALLPATEALSHIPAIFCGSEDVERLEHGLPVVASGDIAPLKSGESPAQALGPEGELVAMGRLVRNGQEVLFWPKRVLTVGRRR